MAADLTQTVDALAKSVSNLADTVNAHGHSDHSSLIVNLVLTVATAGIAVFAYLAARNAARSAQAAEEMVKIERDRLLAAERPRLVLSAGTEDMDDEAIFVTIVENQGSGPAREARLFVFVENVDLPKPVHESHLPYEIPGWATERPSVPVSRGHHLQAAFRFRLCHYTDRQSTPEQPRVYHSILVEERNSRPQQRSFSPESPMEADPDFARYLRWCEACTGKAE